MCKIIISAFLAVLGMPIHMYGERRRRDLQACRPNVQYMAGLGRVQGIRRRLNYIHSMKYAEVINVSIVANSAEIDYSVGAVEKNKQKHTNILRQFRLIKLNTHYELSMSNVERSS